MFIGPHKAKNRRIDECANRGAFTLLEIMLAVGILGLMSVAIFRFVQSNTVALRLATESTAAEAQYDGLRDLLTAEWQSLSPTSANMYGEPFKLEERERDWLRWSCAAGPGLLTRYAPGNFIVTLRLQPENENSDRWDLGLLRKPQNELGVGEGHESWVPLIKNVTTLEIRYFGTSFAPTVWVDRLPGGSLPRLIKITVGRSDAPVPWEAVIPLKRTPY